MIEFEDIKFEDVPDNATMGDVGEKDTTGGQLPVEEWLEIRRQAGAKIDPNTAEVLWAYCETLDPYGIHSDLPEEARQVGREYFARSPGSDIWVWFGDLPDAVAKKLWKMHSSKLAFPAGLEALFSTDPD